MNPLVSVVMPNYNSEKYIQEAIESIINQTYDNWELIIIDDNSKDNSWNIIKSYSEKDNRIRAYKNPKNMKIAKTRNEGLNRVSNTAKYIAVMDSDDVSMNTRIEKQVDFLENNLDFGAIGGHTYIINEDSKIIAERKYETNPEKISKIIIKKSPLANPVSMIRKSVIKELGGYNEKYLRCHDYEMWFRIAENHKLGNIDEYLLKYRLSTTQGKTTHLKDTLRYTLDIQRKWLFNKNFFSISGLLYHLGEYLMYALPSGVILKLFKKMTYKKIRQ